MNKVILMGRLTRDPEVRYSAGDNSQAVANFTLAVDRRFKRDGEQTADFLRCVSFGRQAEFVERYLHQGSKVVVEGRIQTGSYTNREGQKVYTTDIIVENIEFAESKAASDSYQASRSQQTQRGPAPAASSFDDAGGADGLDGFMNIPDGIEEELPFK